MDEDDASTWMSSRERRRGRVVVVRFNLETGQVASEVELTLALASKWLLLAEVVWHSLPLHSDTTVVSNEKILMKKKDMMDNEDSGLSISPFLPENITSAGVVPANTISGSLTRVILISLCATVLFLLVAIITILRNGRRRIFSKRCFPATLGQEHLEESPAYKSRAGLGIDFEDSVYQEPRRSTILKRTSRNRSCGSLLTSPTSMISTPTTLLSSPSLLSPNLDHIFLERRRESRFGSTPHFQRTSSKPPPLPPPTSYSFALELDTFDTQPDHLGTNYLDPDHFGTVRNNSSPYMTPNMPRHEESHYAASDIFSPQCIRTEPNHGVIHSRRIPKMSSEVAFLGHF